MGSLISNMSDNEILSLSYQKPGVFGELFDRYQGRFIAIARANLHSQDAAEDAVQATFIKIYKYGKKFLQDGGDFKSWSNKILQNCIKDQYSKIRSGVTLDEILESVLEAPSEYPEYESSEFLGSVFQRLDSVSGSVLQMRYVLGKSFKQIGRLLGISSGAARVRAYRAKKYFVEAYKQVS